MTSRWALILFAVLNLALLAGCGGGGGSTTGAGSMTFSVNFPPLPVAPADKYLPAVLMSVTLDITDPALVGFPPKVPQVVVNRPSPAGGVVRAVVDNVLIGPTVIDARGYDGADATGKVICEGAATATVPLGRAVYVPLVMGATAVTVEIAGPGTVLAGHDVALTPSARDVDANVLLDPDFGWSSSDETIATVDGDGNVHGVARGNAVITLLERKSGLSANHAITVNPDVDRVVTTPPARTINKNLNFLLHAVAKANGVTEPDVPFSFVSDDQGIARVEPVDASTARIVGVAPGRTRIQVHQPFTGATGTCAVTVTAVGGIDVEID